MADLISPRRIALWTRIALAAALVSLSLPLALVAQDAADSPLPQRAKPRGRLPSYYSQVVTGQQKEQIYSVQAEYEPKLEALREQLAALEKQRDEAIRAVLTPEQRKQVDALAAAAKAKRDERKAQTEQEASSAATAPVGESASAKSR